MTSGTVLSPALADRLDRQLSQWRQNLVALDRRQRLLYFKHTVSSSFELIAPHPAAIAQQLDGASTSLFTQLGDDGESTTLSKTKGTEVGGKSPAELARGLRRLDQASRQSYADRGLWTLYLGLGMLQWIDADDGKTVVSPLVLLPVELTRPGKDRPYELNRTEDEPVFNPALRLKLETYAVELPDLDVDDVDVSAVMNTVRAAIQGRDDWEVLERAVLATFSFHKEAMFRDLGVNQAAVAAHPLVQLLALGPDSPAASTLAFDPIDEDDLDEVSPPEQLVSILDADGTQRRCILAAKTGQSFVMDGPPGTGKSQTIANIIVELIADGRTVLFVSEKAAALDVVRNRLTNAGLNHFLLELHSHAATRKKVVEDLHDALMKKVRAEHHPATADLDELARNRRDLTSYADAMNEIRKPLGRSLFDVLGRISQLRSPVDAALPRAAGWAEVSGSALGEALEHARRLAASWRPVSEGDKFAWADLASIDHDNADARRMADACLGANRAAVALIGLLRAVDEDLGVVLGFSAADMRRRLDLVGLAAEHPFCPDSWLTTAHFDAVTARAAELESDWTRLATARLELQQQAGPGWSELEHEHFAAIDRLGRVDWRPDASRQAADLPPLLDFLVAAPARLSAIAADAQRLASLLNMPQAQITGRRAATYAQLAALGSNPARPEAAWLNPSVQHAVDESIRVLGPLVEMVQKRQQAMQDIFTADALKLDLSVLSARFKDVHTGWGRFSGAARADRKALKSVTKAGKVDKNVLARLEEAAAWQAAHDELTRQEKQFAPQLGGTYRRLDTDFTRVGAALEVAHRAVQLAGADLDTTMLARQLASGNVPDPALEPLSHRVSSALADLTNEADHLLDPSVAAWLQELTLPDAALWCGRLGRALVEPLGAVQQVAAVVGRDVTIGQASALVAAARQAGERETEIQRTHQADAGLLGQLYSDGQTDWPRLRWAIGWTGRVRAAMSGPLPPSVAVNLRSISMTVEQVATRTHEWDITRDTVVGYFEPARSRELRADFDHDIVSAAGAMKSLAETGVHDIDEWCQFESQRQWLRARGLGPALELAEENRVISPAVPVCIEHALLQAWSTEVVHQDERLQRYRSTERDTLVKQFCELDRDLVNRSHAVVAQRCNARRPKSLTGHSSQVLQREAQKKTRHKPIRVLLSETGELVQELKPCFMMSPLSVSQFLPPDLRFDAVIFDEASQVLPSDAINCIYRGEQLIVAGDQKQLPPSDFFTSSDEAEEDLDLDVFDSVLDLAKGAGGLTSLPLSWHYRSRHESLITYSNYRFYDGSLYTFPGAIFESADLGLELIKVDGRYRRGGARDNPIEAEKVAERVAHHLHTNPGLSLGVVTFSSPQEDAVKDALDRRADTDPALAALLTDHDRLDGFFVKSLENVQGDERDIIFFSVGYGPDEHGKFTMNFGPLNRVGGWRRLNVAITRARRRVEVISSFRANDMTDTQSEGLRHLRGYLDFAERGIPALAMLSPGSLGDADSPFEEEVLSVIRSWGYDAVPQVGAAGYRIDMAVRHPDRPGEYVLAVECDGAAYHSAKTARDRDRLREAVLVGLGWTVHRIWGISWWRDRRTQLDRLLAAIVSAIAASDGVRPPAVPVNLAPVVEFDEVDFESVPGWAVPYRSASVDAGSGLEAKDPEARPALRRYFEKVLAIEAPIHESLLTKRFNADWDVGRSGRLIRENTDAALARVNVDGMQVVKDGFGFYRVGGRPTTQVRVPDETGSVRTVTQVPPEELELASENVIRDAVVADREQTIRAVARLFGWGRAGADIHSAVEAALSRLVDRNIVEQVRDVGLRIADRP